MRFFGWRSFHICLFIVTNHHHNQSPTLWKRFADIKREDELNLKPDSLPGVWRSASPDSLHFSPSGGNLFKIHLFAFSVHFSGETAVYRTSPFFLFKLSTQFFGSFMKMVIISANWDSCLKYTHKSSCGIFLRFLLFRRVVGFVWNGIKWIFFATGEKLFGWIMEEIGKDSKLVTPRDFKLILPNFSTNLDVNSGILVKLRLKKLH